MHALFLTLFFPASNSSFLKEFVAVMHTLSSLFLFTSVT